MGKVVVLSLITLYSSFYATLGVITVDFSTWNSSMFAVPHVYLEIYRHKIDPEFKVISLNKTPAHSFLILPLAFTCL